MNDEEWRVFIRHVNREMRFRRKMLLWSAINIAIAMTTLIAFVVVLAISYR